MYYFIIAGKKIDYDPQWKGPLSIERKKTDFPFIVSLGVYLAVWIGISIYGIIHILYLKYPVLSVNTNYSNVHSFQHRKSKDW